jgi:four helix bundle protein
MSYKKIVIWQQARQLVHDIHKMTLNKLPQFELYEEGSQIRRSIKSVKSNIVEGYGRRRYKQDFIRFLTYSLPLVMKLQIIWKPCIKPNH